MEGGCLEQAFINDMWIVARLHLKLRSLIKKKKRGKNIKQGLVFPTATL